MRLCFFGDSFVNGTGDPQRLGWVGRACAMRPEPAAEVTLYNLGIRRDTSADVAARWEGEAARRLPSDADGRLLFSFGVNDCMVEGGVPRVPLDETVAHARSILSRAAAMGPVLFVGPSPIADCEANGRIRATSDELADLCRSLHCPCLDTFAPLSASAVWMGSVAAGDGAHPGAEGYQVLAALVSGWPAWRDWLTF